MTRTGLGIDEGVITGVAVTPGAGEAAEATDGDGPGEGLRAGVSDGPSPAADDGDAAGGSDDGEGLAPLVVQPATRMITATNATSLAISGSLLAGTPRV